MENKNNGIPFFKLLYKNALLIVLITILCTLLATAYNIAFVKPEHSASRTAILRTSVEASNKTNAASNNAALGKRYMPLVESYIKSSKWMSLANEEYNKDGYKGEIIAEKITISYNEDSLIFLITYKSHSKEDAMQKLDVVYKVLEENVNILDEAEVRKTDRWVATSEDSGLTKYVLIGAVLGAFLSVMVVLVIYALDNTVRSKAEIEELTGVSVISVIDKTKHVKK